MVEGQMIQLRTIISNLAVRTSEGKMEWVWDNALESGTTTLVSGQVIVSKDRDFDTVIEIKDTNFNTLEVINVGYGKYSDLKTVADEIYDMARRSALQIDSKLESIIREISD